MKEHRLTWAHGTATVLPTAAMLADCVFDLPNGPFSPFARAPWMGTVTDRTITGHLRELGGDFVGIPFGSGGNGPIHGPAADEDWVVIAVSESAITLALDYPETSPVARLERTISAQADAPALDFSLTVHARRKARISVGLHPIFKLPEHAGELTLAADFDFGLTHPRQTAPGQQQEFFDLPRVPQGKGFVDLAHPPLDQPNLNVQLCGMRGPMIGIYHAEGAGFVLDWDRTLLPSLQIWHTDRGIDGPPWHGTYRGLGLEPIAAAFDMHDDISTGDNIISARGVATAIALDPAQPTIIAHAITAFTVPTDLHKSSSSQKGQSASKITDKTVIS